MAQPGGFKKCSVCAGSMPVADTHTDCFSCLGSQHDMPNCVNCCRLSDRYFNCRLLRLKLWSALDEGYDGGSVAPPPSNMTVSWYKAQLAELGIAQPVGDVLSASAEDATIDALEALDAGSVPMEVPVDVPVTASGSQLSVSQTTSAGILRLAGFPAPPTWQLAGKGGSWGAMQGGLLTASFAPQPSLATSTVSSWSSGASRVPGSAPGTSGFGGWHGQHSVLSAVPGATGVSVPAPSLVAASDSGTTGSVPPVAVASTAMASTVPQPSSTPSVLSAGGADLQNQLMASMAVMIQQQVQAAVSAAIAQRPATGPQHVQQPTPPVAAGGVPPCPAPPASAGGARGLSTPGLGPSASSGVGPDTGDSSLSTGATLQESLLYRDFLRQALPLIGRGDLLTEDSPAVSDPLFNMARLTSNVSGSHWGLEMREEGLRGLSKAFSPPHDTRCLAVANSMFRVSPRGYDQLAKAPVVNDFLKRPDVVGAAHKVEASQVEAWGKRVGRLYESSFATVRLAYHQGLLLEVLMQALPSNTHPAVADLVSYLSRSVLELSSMGAAAAGHCVALQRAMTLAPFSLNHRMKERVLAQPFVGKDLFGPGIDAVLHAESDLARADKQVGSQFIEKPAASGRAAMAAAFLQTKRSAPQASAPKPKRPKEGSQGASGSSQPRTHTPSQSHASRGGRGGGSGRKRSYKGKQSS